MYETQISEINALAAAAQELLAEWTTNRDALIASAAQAAASAAEAASHVDSSD